MASLVGLLPQVVLGPFVGVLVDRWRRRWVMFGADGLVALATLILAVLFWQGIAQVWHVFVILFARAVPPGVRHNDRNKHSPGDSPPDSGDRSALPFHPLLADEALAFYFLQWVHNFQLQAILIRRLGCQYMKFPGRATSFVTVLFFNPRF